jgi:hypothetical protein
MLPLYFAKPMKWASFDASCFTDHMEPHIIVTFSARKLVQTQSRAMCRVICVPAVQKRYMRSANACLQIQGLVVGQMFEGKDRKERPVLLIVKDIVG